MFWVSSVILWGGYFVQVFQVILWEFYMDSKTNGNKLMLYMYF